jgi:hypothetical protein
MQTPMPEQSPDQPVNFEPEAGVEVEVEVEVAAEEVVAGRKLRSGSRPPLAPRRP